VTFDEDLSLKLFQQLSSAASFLLHSFLHVIADKDIAKFHVSTQMCGNAYYILFSFVIAQQGLPFIK